MGSPVAPHLPFFFPWLFWLPEGVPLVVAGGLVVETLPVSAAATLVGVLVVSAVVLVAVAVMMEGGER